MRSQTNVTLNVKMEKVLLFVGQRVATEAESAGLFYNFFFLTKTKIQLQKSQLLKR